MVVQSQEEFVRRLNALPKHARDEHEREGGRCEFHTLSVCSCGNCENDDQILCEGKAFKTRIKLTCDFHGFALRNGVSRVALTTFIIRFYCFTAK